MKVWILKLSEVTYWDTVNYGDRKYRYTMLAEALVNAGHEVMWWTDDFQHFKKDRGHRFGKDHFEELVPGLTIRWIHSPGYKRNVSRRRFCDHQIVAGKMLKDAGNWPKPDLILGAMPTDTMCEVATLVGQRFGVPVVLDVRDHWPDIFFCHVPSFARLLVWVFTCSMRRRVRTSFSRATAIVGITDAFVDWGLRKGRRTGTKLDHAFPIGYSKSSNLKYDEDAAKQFWAAHGVGLDDEIFTICFLGAFSKMYNFTAIIDAAKCMLDDSKPVRFILCGDGPDLERLQNAGGGLPNIFLPGRITGNEIHALMKVSSVGIIPYISHDNFKYSIGNKPAEYLSADLPILISISGIVSDLLKKYECGIQYGNCADLTENLRNLRDNPHVLAKYQEGARRLFSERLDGDKIYKEFVEHLELVERSYHS
jgi:glycosyltransferase involved in cell wall biosynthesis